MDKHQAFELFMKDRERGTSTGHVCSDKTLKLYRETIAAFIDGPWEISQEGINAYLDTQRPETRGIQKSTYALICRCLHAFVTYLYDYQDGPQIKIKPPRIRPQKRHIIRTQDELDKLLSVCRHPRDKALVLFLLQSGCRRGEVVRLTWGDVDLESNRATIHHAKGDKERTVFFTDEVKDALLRIRPKLGDPSDRRVFGFTKPNSLTDRMRILRKRSGVDISTHTFRRSFATAQLRAGVDLIKLQHIMGHENVATTALYIFLNDDDLEEAWVDPLSTLR